MTLECFFKDPIWLHCWDAPEGFEDMQDEYDLNRGRAEQLIRSLGGYDLDAFHQSIDDACFRLQMMRHNGKVLFQPMAVAKLGEALAYKVLESQFKFDIIKTKLSACPVADVDGLTEKLGLVGKVVSISGNRLKDWYLDNREIELDKFHDWCQRNLSNMQGLLTPFEAKGVKRSEGLRCNLTDGEFALIHKGLEAFSLIKNISMDDFESAFRYGKGNIVWHGLHGQLSVFIKYLKARKKIPAKNIWKPAQQIFLIDGEHPKNLRNAEGDLNEVQKKIVLDALKHLS